MYEIDKEFTFEYGHRVHNQTLDADLSVNSECKCRYLHGHSGRIKIGLKSKYLKDSMVLDFNELRFFKKWVDNNIDHKTIIDINDPLIDLIIPNFDNLWRVSTGDFENIILEDLDSNEAEFYKSFIIVDFVPTSENLCRWFFGIVKEKLDKQPIDVAYVDFYETAKSHCRFKED